MENHGEFRTAAAREVIGGLGVVLEISNTIEKARHLGELTEGEVKEDSVFSLDDNGVFPASEGSVKVGVIMISCRSRFRAHSQQCCRRLSELAKHNEASDSVNDIKVEGGCGTRL